MQIRGVNTKSWETDRCSGGCQSFNTTPFNFASPASLLANTSYFVALTSSAADQQSVAYFIKGQGATTIQTSGAAPVILEATIGSSVAPVGVPEPLSLTLLGSGLLGLVMARKHTAA